MKKAILYLSLFTLHCSLLSAQNGNLDSLITSLRTTKEDTLKVRRLIYCANSLEAISQYRRGDSLARQAMDIAGRLGYKWGYARALTTSATFADELGNSSQALEKYAEAKRIFEELNDKQNIGKVLIDVGVVYWEMGNYPDALKNYVEALQIARGMGDKENMAKNDANIGLLYMDEKNTTQALKYYGDALDISKELGNKEDVAIITGDIAIAYADANDTLKALDYYNNAIKLFDALGDKSGVAINTGNLGDLYAESKQYDKALIHYFKALKIDSAIGAKRDMANRLGNIGEAYMMKKQYAAAEVYLLRCRDLSKEINYLSNSKQCNQSLARLYAETQQWKKAYDSYILYSAASDSLVNQDKSREIGKLEAKADYDKQLALHKAVEEKNKAVADAKSRRQKVIIAFTGAIALSVAIMAMMIFRSLKTTRKQKRVIEEQVNKVEEQKMIVEQKNKEITDSIMYAKRLQDAILPPISEIKAVLPDSFVLYKPKDIVAGDFYWMQPLLNPPHREGLKTSIENINDTPDYYTAAPSLYASLRERAEQFRQNPTEAETVAWKLLKANSLGYHIRRQHIIGQYIVDFANIKTQIIIEIDGDIHDYQKSEDEQRTAWLNKQGFEVIRFRNEEVIHNPEVFTDKVVKKLIEKDKMNESKVSPDGGDLEGAAVLIAACDCTGHGVPGAMVSVVCSNALNRAVKEFGLTEPGRILDKTRELVLETFEKSEGDIKDGMDISLAALIPSEGGMTVKWAGAYNPLWYIEGGEVKEQAADKQPIGKTDNPKPFTTHSFTFPLMGGQRGAGVSLYLFTDGYADQFGGEKGKKYKYKQLSDKLKVISSKSMEEQKRILEEEFEKWKGSNEQTDDVCVIGIRI